MPQHTNIMAEQRSRAVRAVAPQAQDANDFTMLLDMLGLRASDARPPIDSAHDPATEPDMDRQDRQLLISRLTALLTSTDIDIRGLPR